eukprot:1814557-Pleurochrysis_carterae.AAC.1
MRRPGYVGEYRSPRCGKRAALASVQEAQPTGFDCARLAGASAASEGRRLMRAAPAWRRRCMQRAASSADMMWMWEEARAECMVRARAGRG